jgi:glutamine cyclotransferase
MNTGRVLQIHHLPGRYFGEGLTIWGDKLIQLTWKSRLGFIYNLKTLRLIGQFSYSTEGWGLTHDRERLIMSDGSATLHFLHPETFAPIGQLSVSDQTHPVDNLNELEYVNGEIYANVWQTERIAKISAKTGQVLGWIDVHGLLQKQNFPDPVDFPNGIAYDFIGDHLFLTGKYWPTVFEVSLLPNE